MAAPFNSPHKKNCSLRCRRNPGNARPKRNLRRVSHGLVFILAPTTPSIFWYFGISSARRHSTGRIVQFLDQFCPSLVWRSPVMGRDHLISQRHIDAQYVESNAVRSDTDNPHGTDHKRTSAFTSSAVEVGGGAIALPTCLHIHWETALMRREQLTEKILDIKRSKGWTWKYITTEIGGVSPILVVGALLGQMKLVKPLARKAAALLVSQKTKSEC